MNHYHASIPQRTERRIVRRDMQTRTRTTVCGAPITAMDAAPADFIKSARSGFRFAITDASACPDCIAELTRRGAWR